jgi:hypothetical protein
MRIIALVFFFSILATSAQTATKTWVWCSDNKCSDRKEFDTADECYKKKKVDGGYCY